jgi:exodeoxyribonuclease VII large subunit
VDVSIADLVADHHAHTPTEAARVATSHWYKIHELLPSIQNRLHREIRGVLQDAAHRLSAIEQHEIFRRPTDRINDLQLILDDRQQSLLLAIHAFMRRRQKQLQFLGDRLQRQTPAAQMARGSERLQQMQRNLLAALQARLRTQHETLSANAAMLAEHHPRGLVRFQQSRLADMNDRLGRAMRLDLRQRNDLVAALAVHLEALSPQRVLERGYTVTRMKKTGAVVRRAGELNEHDRIVTRFSNGEVESVVEDRQQPKLFE